MSRLFNIALISLGVAGLASCKKDFDHPPENLLSTTKVVTIDSLRNWQQSSGVVTITDSLHVYGIVTMDESQGNIYKNLYVQDHTAGINVRLTSGSSFAVGDSVRIALIGAVLSEYSGVIQLDSIDPDTDIILQSSGHDLIPESVNLSDITLEDEGKLIKLFAVQFTQNELINTYADAANQSSESRYIEDCAGNTIIVRTSGFATFAGDSVAQGNGSLVAIVNRYNDELQLIIRDINELDMSGDRCLVLRKDFDDELINTGGWSTQIVTGTHNWTIGTIGAATPYVQMSNYTAPNNYNSEVWLISPQLDLSSGEGKMSFMNAYNYSGDPLQLMVSTDFPGTGDPSLSSWTDISSSVTWSGGSWAWVSSGDVSLASFNTTSVYVAFKYTGSNTDGSTWEIDDIIILD